METTGPTKHETLEQTLERIDQEMEKLGLADDYREVVLANMWEHFWEENEYDGPDESY